MKRVALCAFALAWLAACETPPSAPTPQTPLIPPPSFATLANERIPVAGDFAVNTCLPKEDVQFLNGFLHVLVTEKIGATSSAFTIHFNAQGIEGVGLETGERYSVPINEKDEMTFTAEPLTFSQEFDLRFPLIRAGSLDNLWLRITFTLTSPPGTEDVRRAEIECRG